MAFNKKFFTTGGIVASTPAAAAFDPLQNFEIVTYTGNGGTQKITGYIRKGAAFNGSSSVIDFSQPLLINTFSVSFWINTTSTASQRILGNPYGGAGDYGWNIRIEATTGHLEVEWSADGTNAIILDTATSVIDGNWHHIVATWDEGSQKIYIDDNEEASSTNASDQYATTDTFKIGANWNNTAHYNGKLDQVRIFNTALNPTQVGQLKDEEYGDAKNSTTDFFGNSSGVALYQLDENANDTGAPIDSGQSAVFNGSNSVINVPSSTLDITNDFTVSGWVNQESSDVNLHIFACTDTNSNNIHFDANIQPTQNRVALVYNNVAILKSLTYESGWHHYAFTLSGTTLTTYRNGSVLGTPDTVTVASTSGSRQTIGTRLRQNYSSYGSGKLDQVRIYNTALSSGNVTNLYNESNVPSANLVAHYKLDGNGNDETTNNNATSVSNVTYSDPAKTEHNGTPTNVNFLGMAFQPDLVWIKNRDTTSVGTIHDTINGAGYYVIPSTTNQLSTLQTDVFSSFDSNGFTVGTSSATNGNTNDIVAWCWKAAGTTTTIAANTVGNTIASDVRANTAAGFSIVKYAGQIATGQSGVDTVGHGLSAEPELVIIKSLDLVGLWWAVYHKDISQSGKYLRLNETSAQLTPSNSNDIWGNGMTSDVIGIGDSGGVNRDTSDYIAYCFHSVDGYQKVGTYEGNGSTTGPIQNIGFQPRFLMIKGYDIQRNWVILDSVRGYGNNLSANTNLAEYLTSNNQGQEVDFLTNGFQIKTSSSWTNNLNSNYIYLAIA